MQIALQLMLPRFPVLRAVHCMHPVAPSILPEEILRVSQYYLCFPFGIVRFRKDSKVFKKRFVRHAHLIAETEQHHAYTFVYLIREGFAIKG